MNQFQKINSGTDPTLNPYSSLKVSFWMKTLDNDFYNSENPPSIEASIHVGSTPNTNLETSDLQTTNEAIGDEYWNIIGDNQFWSSEYLQSYGSHNSKHLWPQHTTEYSSTSRFVNDQLQVWQKMEYTFNLDERHVITSGAYKGNIQDLSTQSL